MENITEKTTNTFLSLYDKGYVRVNKHLTKKMDLKEGDTVGFFRDGQNFFFGKTAGQGLKVRKQKKVEAMFFNASSICRMLRKNLNLPPTGPVTLRATKTEKDEWKIKPVDDPL